MARSYAVFVALALLAVSAVAQPGFWTITNSSASSDTAFPTTTATDYITPTNILYSRIQLPYNAYYAWANATMPATALSSTGCYDYSGSASTSSIWFDFQVSKYFPCSQNWNTYWYTGTATRPQVVCYNTDGLIGMEYDSALIENYQSESLFVGIDNAPSFTNGATNYISNNYIEMTPNQDLWVGVGRWSASDTQIGCSLSTSSYVQTCPEGQMAYTGVGFGTAPCQAYQNISVGAGGVLSSTPITGQTAVYVLDKIPTSASLIIVNVTIPASVATTVYGAGGSWLISAYGASTSSNTEAECSIYYSDSPTVSGTDQTFSVYCYAPKWGQPYYFALDTGTATSISTVFQVVTCATGFTGTDCQDPLVELNLFESTHTYSVSSGPTGFAHFYMDVPAWTWNTSIINFNVSVSTGTNYLWLRPNAYSTESGVTPLNGHSVYNTYEGSNFQQSDVVAGIASTPFERYASYPIRWVFTIQCYTGTGVGSPCTLTPSHFFLPANEVQGVPGYASPPVAPSAPTAPHAPTAPTAPTPTAPHAPTSTPPTTTPTAPTSGPIAPTAGTPPSGGSPPPTPVSSAAALAPLSALLLALLAIFAF